MKGSEILLISALYKDTHERLYLISVLGIPNMVSVDLDDFKNAIGRIEARNAQLIPDETPNMKVL